MFMVPECCRQCKWYREPEPLMFGVSTGKCENPDMDTKTRKVSDALAIQSRPSTCPFNIHTEIFYGRDKLGYY